MADCMLGVCLLIHFNMVQEDLKKILPVPAVVAENTIQVATVTLKVSCTPL